MAEVALAQRILAVKENAARAQKTRADADAVLNLAQTQLKQVDEELVKYGINPEHGEQELAQAEQQLEVLVTQLEAEVAREQAGAEAILAQARQAQLIR